MKHYILSALVFIVAVLLVVTLSSLPSGAAHAAAAAQTPAPSTCNACHPRSFTGEVHGLGTKNPGFAAAWQAQNKPAECLACHVTGYDPKTDQWKSDAITCEACHSPIPGDHPDQNIPVDKSNDLCAKCHNDSRFGWSDWKTSVHYQQNMACVTCHDPHLPKRAAGEVVSVICENCHKDMSQRSEHSTHTAAGVTCIQCHLGPKKGPDEFHKVPDHSFKPVVETCNGCHASQMHDANPTAAASLTPTPVVESTAVATATPVMAVSPQSPAAGSSILSDGVAGLTPLDLGFFAAALLGIGAIGGLFLSPITRQFERFFSSDGKK
jgi:predicted CXXCH cytochrome family protein